MMKLLSQGLLTLSLLHPLVAVAADWELIEEKDGIKIYKRQETDSALISFAGECVVDAKPATIAAVLNDHKRKGEWMANLMEARLIEEFNGMSSIVYSSFKSPGFISNRDFIYKYDFKVDPKTHAVNLTVLSTEHTQAPATVGVRGQLNYSVYVMEPMPDGKTRFRGEINVDPKGWLPAWLVNLTQKKLLLTGIF